MLSKENLKKLGYELTADEEFERLGYKKTEETKQEIEYTLENFNIMFDLKSKFVSFWGIDDIWLDVSKGEIKAIYKKIKELGWLDE